MRNAANIPLFKVENIDLKGTDKKNKGGGEYTPYYIFNIKVVVGVLFLA